MENGQDVSSVAFAERPSQVTKMVSSCGSFPSLRTMRAFRGVTVVVRVSVTVVDDVALDSLPQPVNTVAAAAQIMAAALRYDIVTPVSEMNRGFMLDNIIT